MVFRRNLKQNSSSVHPLLTKTSSQTNYGFHKVVQSEAGVLEALNLLLSFDARDGQEPKEWGNLWATEAGGENDSGQGTSDLWASVLPMKQLVVEVGNQQEETR